MANKLSEYARMALADVRRRGTCHYWVLAACYGNDALRELWRSGKVRATGRGRNRKYHMAEVARER